MRWIWLFLTSQTKALCHTGHRAGEVQSQALNTGGRGSLALHTVTTRQPPALGDISYTQQTGKVSRINGTLHYHLSWHVCLCDSDDGAVVLRQPSAVQDILGFWGGISHPDLPTLPKDPQTEAEP
jgi:hypothetical protein